ncbi:MAG: hypothetical protein WD042_12010 [Phycisphaeraceae bacterium]
MDRSIQGKLSGGYSRGFSGGLSALAVGAVLVGSAGSASALTMTGGTVTDWGLTPFSQPNGTSNVGGVTSIIGNNYSPIDYPNGIHHQPSPGGSTGELYDLEEMHIRNSGGQVQVLLVLSSPMVQGNLKLGDLLIKTNGNPLFDHALVTQAHNGFLAGSYYQDITTAGLQNVSGSYLGNSGVEQQISNGAGQLAATFLAGGAATGSTYAIASEVHSYGTIAGANENNTWLHEFTFDVAGDVNSIDLQMVWGCGNDVIAGSHTLTWPTPAPPTGAAPEMTTAILSAMGLGSLLIGRRRQRASSIV